jgi:hypothetical protein
MRCLLDVSQSSSKSLGKIRAFPGADLSPKVRLNSGSGKINAFLSVTTSLGNARYSSSLIPVFTQFFGSLFGNSAPYITANKNDGRIKAESNIRILNTTKYQLASGHPFQQASTEQEVLFLKNNPNTRSIKTANFEFTSLCVRSRVSGSVKVSANLGVENLNLKSRISSESSFKISDKTEKLSGHLKTNIFPTQKLYPIADVSTSGLINHKLEYDNLYQSIDGGIIVGDYLKPYGNTVLISDDDKSYVQLYSTSGRNSFHVAFEVTPPTITPQYSLLSLRAAAPKNTRETDVTPTYNIRNIRFEDPSGNIIVTYKDLKIIGDADYRQVDVKNYTTYITESEFNFANRNTWYKEYPVLGKASGYILKMDIDATCESKPFNSAFNFSYENKCKTDNVQNSTNDYLSIDGAPLSTQYQDFEINPDNSLRISAFEILCSGTKYGYLKDSYLNFYVEVPPTGNRLQRTIYPVEVLDSNNTEQANPLIESIWKASPDLDGNTSFNTSQSGSKVLTNRLTDYNKFGYITLQSPSQSGKLNLRFAHEPPIFFLSNRGGSFNFGRRKSSFSKSELAFVRGYDTIFNIDEIYLKVIARKENANVPDYPLDIMGWSKDYVLNNTPKVGAFLQNADTNISQLPISSGFMSTDELGISSESISDKDQYKQYYTLNDGGDHILISSGLLVNSTDFKEYIVPLKIYNTFDGLGIPTDYAHSTFFENLFIDIYPLPSGASIARAELIVKYGPCNAIPLSITGFEEEDLFLREFVLFPNSNTTGHRPLNIYRSNERLSKLDNIPHGFNSPYNLKTNYSRRWRGSDGAFKRGPFDSTEFDYSYEQLQQDYPFTMGYYDFNNRHNNAIISNIDEYSGVFIGSAHNSIYKNLGWRLNTNSIYQNRNIRSIDWTNENHQLYGKISDSFDSAIRVSGINGYFQVNPFDITGGFSAHVRISPDVTISGANYNLFNSGVIISKWNAGSALEFTLGYSGGYLIARASDQNQNLITIADTVTYDAYQYPLSILLTYNDNNSRKLKLYTDKELDGSNFVKLRSASQAFNIYNASGNITFGYSHGSGVGYNGYICGIGLSNATSASGTNLVENNPIKKFLQSDVASFFDSHRANIVNENNFSTTDNFGLWKFINNDTSKWSLGEFKYCQFSPDFKVMSHRDGENFIVHNFKTNGETYNSLTNLPSPTNINLSGISYHTQIENDALRISLTDDDGRLYTPARRISKTFPRGYNFEKDAIFVETIMQHETTSNIEWPDGKLGPRVIVSLYTPTKEAKSFDSSNIGLINRKIHHINPDECWFKLESTFDINDLMDDTTEPWSNFRKENVVSEFNHKYYSNDINQMFLQYDVVYPSGHFESYIKLHSVNVRLKDALCKPQMFNDILHIYSSGDSIVQKALPLSLPSVFDSLNNSDDPLSLFASGYIVPISSSVMSMYSSGVFSIEDTLNLNTRAFRSTRPIQSFGSYFNSTPYDDYRIPLVVVGRNKFSEDTVSLYAQADPIPSITDTLVLFTQFPYYKDNISIPLFVNGTEAIPEYLASSGSANLTVVAPPIPDSFITSSSMSLYTHNPSDIVIITDYVGINNSVGLSITNFSDILNLQEGLESFTWNSNNPGLDILISDNAYASIPLSDNIRGVQTICYGNCENNDGCKEFELFTHETLWNEPDCIEGGVARAIGTYSNLEDGYLGNYYGIRKFAGLIPNSPYNITISAITGNSGILEGPREINEWEYGTNDDVDYSGIQICQTPNYRQSGNLFGKDVVIKKDLMAIGAPGQDLYEHTGFLCEDAGAIFVYKRDPEPSGYDWKQQGHKSGWELENVLTLPSGFIRDYSLNTRRTLGGFDIQQRNWYVGQQGRELGHSLDMARTNSKDIIVAGGPGAIFNRTFPQVQLDPVNVCLMCFTDEFNASNSTGSLVTILNSIQNSNILFKYFANPGVYFNVKILILEPVIGTSLPQSPPVPKELQSYVSKFRINRHRNFDRSSSEYQDKNRLILNDIKNAFHEVFPHDPTKPNSNIPPIVGVSVDTSISLGYKPIQTALDDFIRYYQEYSLASGIIDFNGDPRSGYIYSYGSDSENWINQSTQILAEVLDTGRLISSNSYLLFTGNLGSFNSQLSEFNTLPPSGTSVYVFERSSGQNWEVVQEIKSPDLLTKLNVPVDRFGHDVAISDDGQIIVVGSPYIKQGVRIYERRRDVDINNSLDAAFYRWMNAEKANVGGHAFNLWNKYTTQNISLRNLYQELNSSGRFDLRQKYDIPYYNLIEEYTTDDIMSHESFSWDFFYKEFLPNSRLGYSVDTNEDGSLIVAGAPTDSLGANDSANIWWLPSQPNRKENWRSYVNAGAVRVLESRNYYPHNKIAEYGIFGNKHRSISHPSDELFYYMFDDAFDNEFVRTPFAETEIPQDAGTLFIITPEINALSDEVVNNIKEWLALGDRNLVLVGDDPSWESSGIYRQSNIIINNLLSKLDSRMRLHSARSKEESLHFFDGVVGNVVASFVPKETIGTYISNSPLNGSGVADIRLYYPDIDTKNIQKYNCLSQIIEEEIDFDGPVLDWMITDVVKRGYAKYNNICNMPLTHNGDLRAQWFDERGPSINGPDFKPFPDAVNLAKYFLSSSWGLQIWQYEREGGSPTILPPTYQYEPRPIMAAGRRNPDKVVNIPSVPATTGISTRTILERIGSEYLDASYKKFGNDPSPEVAMLWSSHSGNYIDLNINFSRSVNDSRFFDPSEYNGKDAVLMAKAETFEKTVYSPKLFLDKYYYAAKELLANNSEVTLIAGQFTESYANLFAGSDSNLNFYGNIVAFNKDGGARIAQIGGFTKQESFISIYDKSAFIANMEIFGNTVTENVTPEQLKQSADTYNVAWIGNPKTFASDEDISNLQQWLNRGNKKIVITYGGDDRVDVFDEEKSPDLSTFIQHANVATDLCKKLNLSMKPAFLVGKNTYASRRYWTSVSDFLAFDWLDIADYAPIKLGFNNPQTYIQQFTSFSNKQYLEIIPIDIQSGIPLAYYGPKVYDDAYSDIGLPRLKTGITKVTFPAQQGSGYRLFFDFVSEHPNEKKPLRCYINNVSQNVREQVYVPSRTSLRDYDKNDNINYLLTVAHGAEVYSEVNNFDGQIRTKFVDCFVPSGYGNEISIFIDGSDISETNSTINPDTVRTHRLVSISGCLLPILNVPFTTEKPIYEPKVVTTTIVTPARPAFSYVISGVYGSISNSSNKYCPCDFPNDPPIEDGPVVVAQEIYHQGGFNAGVNKSRITLIADASIIQGKFAFYNSQATSRTRSFLNSLYPRVNFPSNHFGRQYENKYKIVSPERSSPHKLVNYTNNSGLLVKFKGNINSYFNKNLNTYSDNDHTLNPSFYPQMLGPERGIPVAFTMPRLVGDDTSIQEARRNEVERFEYNQVLNNAYCKFSGIINGKMYQDSSIYGEVPELMKDTGHDYIDLPMLISYSGYPGDLFGYSVKVKDGKIYVGCPFAPFASEQITDWDKVITNTPTGYPASGIAVDYNGGAGAVFVFNKSATFNQDYYIDNPWGCTRKIRPSTINGSDMFGFNFDIDGDVLTIGAPGHDFDTIFSKNINSGEFVTKEFNEQFDIAKNSIIDLGSNTNRNIYGSGIITKNNGAVYAYENKISDWSSKKMSWTVTQKLLPQGFNARENNNFFGMSVSLDRARRNDGDYTLIVGSPYNTSGINNTYTALKEAGSIYTYDSMLRRPKPSVAHPETYIAGSLIGKSGYLQSSATINIQKSPSTPFNSATGFGNFYPFNPIQWSGSVTQTGTHVLFTSLVNGTLDFNIILSGACGDYGCDSFEITKNGTVVWTPDHGGLGENINLSNTIPVSSGDIFRINIVNEYGANFKGFSANIEPIDNGEDVTVKVPFYFANNNEYNKRYIQYGRLFSNENGEIFIEVSGQDKINRGFITHRPYIEYIRGSYDFGKRLTDSQPLFIEGKMLETSGSMNLYTKYFDSLNVYNNMTLYVDSILGESSGNILLYNSGIMPENITFNTLMLSTEAENPLGFDYLNLNTRGMY